MGGAVDIESIEATLNSIINDTRVSDVIETVGNIFDCFSVDRFIAVNSEKELEDVAHKLSQKKMFYAGFYFTNDVSTNEISYKLRMETDNTPVTIESKSRFWFPGSGGSFELEMRYHRGFIEIQNIIDNAIIKHKKKKLAESRKSSESDDLDFSDFDGIKASKPNDTSYEADDDFGGLKLSDDGEFDDDIKTTSTTTQGPEINYADIYKTFQDKINISSSDVDAFSDDGDFWDDDETDTDSTGIATDGPETTMKPTASRKKRQFESLLSMFGIGEDNSSEKSKGPTKFTVDDIQIYTKQFPFPKYTRDGFKKGLYLAQAVQVCFFFALIVHIGLSGMNAL